LSLGDPQVQILTAIPFSPAIAAVIVRKWITREGFRDAGLRPRVRTAWFYYLLAWISPMLVLAATVGLAVAFGQYRPDLSPQQALAGMELDLVELLLVLPAPVVLLLVDAGGLNRSTADLLELIPLAALCAWIVLAGQLRPSRDAGTRTPAAAVLGRTHAA
jgi:hypothetical protein